VLFFRVLNALLVAYLLLILLRVIMSWFQRSVAGRPVALLVRVTEPYLALFRGLRFLRIGPLDLSPMAAILTLAMALDLVGALRDAQRLTLGIFLAGLTDALWFGVSFVLVLLILLIVLVLAFLAFGRGTGAALVQTLAAVLHPVTAWVRGWSGGLFGRRRTPSESQILLLSAVVLVLLLIAGSLLVPLLRSVLLRLPL
jgi:YggT family protein